MRKPLVLLLTHTGDHFTIDHVEREVASQGGHPIRLNTDTFPAHITLSVEQPTDRPRRHTLAVGGDVIDLDAVHAVWARRLWPGRMPDGMDAQLAFYARKESRTAFFDAFALVHARWVNPLEEMIRAESKMLQLKQAQARHLCVPPTLISNDPGEVRVFWDTQGGKVVTKLLGALSQTMRGTGDFMYTSRVREEDLHALDAVQLCPQIFQREIPKKAELRCIVVGERIFVGALRHGAGREFPIDWRQPGAEGNLVWEHASLPPELCEKLIGLTQDLGLVYGAIDLILTPQGEYVFLEINPAGEWGWLQRDLELPIAEAIAGELVRAGARG